MVNLRFWMIFHAFTSSVSSSNELYDTTEAYTCRDCCLNTNFSSKLACCDQSSDNSVEYGGCIGLPCCTPGRLDSNKFSSLYLWKPCLPYINCRTNNICNKKSVSNITKELKESWKCTELCCKTITNDNIWQTFNSFPNENNTKASISFNMNDIENYFFINNEPKKTIIQQILIPYPSLWKWNKNITKCYLNNLNLEINCNYLILGENEFIFIDLNNLKLNLFTINIINLTTPFGVVLNPISKNIYFIGKLPSFEYHVYTSQFLFHSIQYGTINKGIFKPHNILSQAVDNATLLFESTIELSMNLLIQLNFSQSNFNFIDSLWYYNNTILNGTYNEKEKIWQLLIPNKFPSNKLIEFTVIRARNPEATYIDTFSTVDIDIFTSTTPKLIVAKGIITIILVHDSTTTLPSSPYNWISLVLLLLSFLFCFLMLFKHGLSLNLNNSIKFFSDITAITSVIGLFLGILNNCIWIAGFPTYIYFYIKCLISSFVFTMLLSVCCHWGALLSSYIRKLKKKIIFFLFLNIFFYFFQFFISYLYYDIIQMVYNAEKSVSIFDLTYSCKNKATLLYVYSDIQPFFKNCYLNHLKQQDIYFFTWFSNITYSIFAILTLCVLSLGYMVMKRGSKILKLISYSPQQIYLMKALRLYTALITLVTFTYLIAFGMQFIQIEIPYYWWYLTTIWLPQCIPPCCFIFLQWNSATKSLRKENEQKIFGSKENITTPRIITELINPFEYHDDFIHRNQPSVGLSLQLRLPNDVADGVYIAIETQVDSNEKWIRVDTTDTIIPQLIQEEYVVSFLSIAHLVVLPKGLVRFLVYSARESIMDVSSHDSHHAAQVDGFEYFQDDTDSDEDVEDPLLLFLQPSDRCIASFTADTCTFLKEEGFQLHAPSDQNRLNGSCILNVHFVNEIDTRRDTTQGGRMSMGGCISSQYHIQNLNLLVIEDLMESPFGNIISGQYIDIILARRTKEYWQARQDYEQFIALETARIHQNESMGTLYENLLEQIQDQADRRQCREWLYERVEIRKKYIDILKNGRHIAWKRESSREYFKPSIKKKDFQLGFLPLNLHIQEMHVIQNRKSNIYETTTVGVFAAHSLGFKQGGLFSYQQELSKCKPINVSSLFPTTWQYLSQVERRRSDLEWIINKRLDLCIPQALASLVTSFSSKLNCEKKKKNYIENLIQFGFLFHIESLLSTYGTELGMLEDMMITINQLKNYRILIQSENEINYLSNTNDTNPIQNNYSVNETTWTKLILSVDLYSNLDDAYNGNHSNAKSNDTDFIIRVVVRNGIDIPKRCLIDIHPILVNQGINEKQTLANMSTSYPKKLQDHINENAMNQLKELVHFHCERQPNDEMAMELLREFTQAVQISNSSRKKHPEVLQISSRLVRHLNGGRLTICKSAKDRTAMSLTLEQGMILHWHHDLPLAKVPEIVATMRTRGVRIENAMKNTGRRKFAFNALQRSMMPEQYRCPPEVGGRNMS